MRLSLDEVMLGCALMLSLRATCPKRAVGCVLTDAYGFIIGTGYNGVASGLQHCTEHGCGGEHCGTGTDTCQAIHAELNALIRCSAPREIYTCYTTTLPCNNCMKTLLNTGCRRIVYGEVHEDAAAVLARWYAAGRTATRLNIAEIHA